MATNVRYGHKLFFFFFFGGEFPPSFSFLVDNSRQNHRISPMEDLKSEFKTGRSGLGGERFHRSVEQIDEVLFFCFILQCGSGCSLITK